MKTPELEKWFTGAREWKKLSKNKLARLAGCSHTTISKIENGALPRVDLALRLCRVLGVTPSLVWGKPAPKG